MMTSVEDMREWINIVHSLNENASKEIINEWSFDIVDFYPNTSEWENYIKPNRGKIWEFLNKGYQASGLGQFVGCDNEKSLYKNACLIRIAYYKELWVAISVYTSYRGGKKNVGITATTDKLFHKIGVNAVRQIVQKDISSYSEFYWTECSGAIEHLYEKYDGIKIPSEFAVEVVGGDATPIGGNDLYHYTRTINNESLTKIIYGFNTPDTFNAVKEKYSHYIQSCIQRIEEKRIDETVETPSFGKYSSVDCAVNIINIFVDLRWENKMYEFPKEQLNVLKQNVNSLRDLMNGDCHSKEKLQIVRQAISNGEEILSTSLPMELHQFKS